jgi:hypothetical protein
VNPALGAVVSFRTLRPAESDTSVLERAGSNAALENGVVTESRSKRLRSSSCHNQNRPILRLVKEWCVHGQSERSATAAVKRSSGQTSIPSSVLR